MTSNSLKVGGVVTFWSLCEGTSLKALAAGFDALGMAKYVPEPPTDRACLRAALEAAFPRHLIRPLARRDGFTVVHERRGESRNEYDHHVTYTLGADGAPVPGGDDADQAAVFEAFFAAKGRLDSAAVTGALTAVLAGMSGARLRPRGGIYWLSEGSVSRWSQVAGVVEGAAVTGTNAVYQIRHQMDADAVRAVRDAVIGEIETDLAKLDQEIMSGELGSRALGNRELLCSEMRDKVRLYESLLSTGLASLHEALDKAELSMAQAAMLAAATAVSEGVTA